MGWPVSCAYFAMISLLPFILGTLSAWHGGRIVGGTPKAIKNLAWCLPFAVCVGIYCPFWTLVFVPLCYLKTTGHGRVWIPTLPLDTTKDPEKAEYLLKWLYGRVSDYWYKVIAMALIGFAAVSGAAIAFAFVSPLSALCIAVGGLFKGVNAAIFREATEVREYADGCAAGCGLVAAFLVM